MPEPTPPPATAPGQALPPPTPPQQAPQITPPAPQAAPTTPAVPPTVTPPVVQPSAELVALKAERDQLAQSQLEAQRKITQQGQQLAQLVGAQVPAQPTDPLKPYVEMLTKQGYDEKDARAIAGVSHAMMQPVMQATQQQQAMIQGTAMVNQVMQEAWTKMPQVFAANPAIGQRVEQVLRNNALAGQPIDAEYALNLAFIEEGRARFAQHTGAQLPPPVQQPPSFQSMFAPQPGFQQPIPAVQQAPQRTPEQQAWDSDLKKMYPTKTA